MNIHYCANYWEMSELSCNSIISDLRVRTEQLICTPTGYSPEGLYKNLESYYITEPKTFKNLSIIKLDEWGGIPSADPNSCEAFIQKKILKPLNISKDRYVSFKSNPLSPEKECVRIQKEINKKGPIDICILGLGKNGHIGFNEPSDALNPNIHIAKLSHESLKHNMTNGMSTIPSFGLTLGMKDILNSKKIILLLSGSNKKTVTEQLLSKKITPYLPASFLWLHSHVECFIDTSME